MRTRDDLLCEIKAIQAELEDLQLEHASLKEGPFDRSAHRQHGKRLAEVTERIRQFREVLRPALDSRRERIH